jgi:hypothetical protein
LAQRHIGQETFCARALAAYLDTDRDGNLTRHQFVHGKMLPLAKMVFDGFDMNSDGKVDMSEATLETLLRPPFLRTLATEVFDLLDVNNDNFISGEDNLEFSLVMNLERNPTIIYALYSVLDRCGVQCTLVEG